MLISEAARRSRREYVDQQGASDRAAGGRVEGSHVGRSSTKAKTTDALAKVRDNQKQQG